jgi:outer membrane protein TolC
VPQALSGWRPTVVMAGTAGYGDGMSRSFSSSAGHWINTQTDRVIGTAQTTLTQPLYTGGKTQASVNRAKNQVMAERANLINQEQTSFINTVIAYVGPAVPLSANQVQVGVIETQQLLALVKTARDASIMAQVSFQGQVFQQNNAAARSTQVNGYQAVGQLAVPVYQGGAEYSAVRQARQSAQQTTQQVDDARRTAVQAAVQAWEQLVAARASADSTREAVRANEIALEGVEREAIVGSRTTLDVLNAQQTLLNSRVSLVQNLAQIVADSYQVAQAIGRLTAHDLHLPVPLYDETAYYEAVKNKWVGLGDYATNQPGR